jgi:hypothetical protein
MRLAAYPHALGVAARLARVVAIFAAEASWVHALGGGESDPWWKLKAHGTSYQMLLDDVRQELAIWYLRQTDLSVEAIAERLGYSDTSNFSRTCKRWFGLTPRQIRQGR